MLEIIDNGYVFSDDKQKLDPVAIHHYLGTQSYWAQNIPMEIVKRSIENSLCFGIYKAEQQIGFARWITDKATFAWLADVYVEEIYRGQGLSKKLMSLMLFHPDLQDLRTYSLATLDAHNLYAQFGFKPLSAPEKLMEIRVHDVYEEM